MKTFALECECPICGENTDWFYITLSEHVFYRHVPKYSQSRRCWCCQPHNTALYFKTAERFWRHIQANGGIREHWLRCALGVTE